MEKLLSVFPPRTSTVKIAGNPSNREDVNLNSIVSPTLKSVVAVTVLIGEVDTSVDIKGTETTTLV